MLKVSKEFFPEKKALYQEEFTIWLLTTWSTKLWEWVCGENLWETFGLVRFLGVGAVCGGAVHVRVKFYPQSGVWFFRFLIILQIGNCTSMYCQDCRHMFWWAFSMLQSHFDRYLAVLNPKKTQCLSESHRTLIEDLFAWKSNIIQLVLYKLIRDQRKCYRCHNSKESRICPLSYNTDGR